MSILDSCPDAWERLTLGELTADTRPICYGVLKPGPDTPNGVPLVRIQDLRDGTVDTTGLHYISSELDQEFARSRLKGGEVLISIQGTIGRVAICPSSLAGANISRTIAVIKPDSRVRPRFLAHYLRLLEAASAFPTQGATRASLNIGALRQLTIPVPRKEEQDKVVATLARHLGDIARGQASLGRAKSALEPYRASTLRAVLSGSADALPADVRDALSSAPRRTLSQLADIQYGWTAKATTEMVGPRMLRITDIQDGHVDWEQVPYCEVPEDKRATFLLGPGDIVFARIGATTGKSYLIDDEVPTAVFASYLIRVRPRDVLRSDFLALFFQGADYWAHIHRESRGVGRPAVNGKLLGALEIPVPPLDAQRAAVEHAHRHLAAVRTYGEVVERNLADVERVKLAVLAYAMTGHLDLAERDNPQAVLEAE